jgi:hypothetical protein
MRRTVVLTVAALLALAGAARASDPIGGYTVVDKVVLEPSESPTAVQVWGSFALAKERGGRTYADPERGYLYYAAPAGKEAVCRREWNDLKKAAGTGQVIGFGDSYDIKALGQVRKANEKPKSPDTYPLGNGLVKIDVSDEQRSYSNWTPIANLLAQPAPKEPGDGDLVPPGEITLAVRNILDKKHAKAKYVFELEGASGGKEEATVEAGDKETKWTPKTKLKAGEKYTWRVRAKEGDWKGPAATSAIVVKGKK